MSRPHHVSLSLSFSLSVSFYLSFPLSCIIAEKNSEVPIQDNPTLEWFKTDDWGCSLHRRGGSIKFCRKSKNCRKNNTNKYTVELSMTSNFNKVNTAKSGSTIVKSCLKCRYNNTNFLMTNKSIFLLLFGVFILVFSVL